MTVRISSSLVAAEVESLRPNLNNFTLEQCSWNLLTPPPPDARPLPAPFGDNDERHEIEFIKFHPSLNRVAYTTITRPQYCNDEETADCWEEGGGRNFIIGETRIIVHDFNVIDATTTCIPAMIHGDGEKNYDSKIVASFTLHELNIQINEFRSNQNRTMKMNSNTNSSSSNSSSNSSNSSNSKNTSETRSTFTVEMLGAIQNIDFLPHNNEFANKMKNNEDKDRLMNLNHLRLMIGFRQCVVVVSIDQSIREASIRASASGGRGGARWLQVIAYIGLDYHLENSHKNEKALKKLPSSFPVPLSETILAFGCYDGGIRFYDIVRQKTVKSCLGPNGRGNPIVKMVLANQLDSNSDSVVPSALRKDHFRHPKNTASFILRPRLISVSATGDAYLWEPELSFDIDNVAECVLNIPPPLASMDGLVAAVSGSGMPVVYHTALTSSSIASLSPLSPWEQMDEINSLFEVSYDPHQDLFCWVFSPDCVGSSLKPRASRDERLKMNGVMVCWKLTELPLHSGWPPPALPPYCVVQVPRTKHGRVSAEMVAGPGFMWNHQFLLTFYVTSSDELMVVKSDLKEKGESIHVKSRVSMLAEMKTFASHAKRGFDCFSIVAASDINRSLIAVGTQHGVLLAELARKELPLPSVIETAKNFARPSSVHRFSDITFENKWSFSEQRPTLLAERVSELECRNRELEFQLDEIMQEAHDTFSNKECSGSRSHRHDVLETELGTALETIERLENEVRVKNESCEALEGKVKALESTLDRVNQELEQECHIHTATVQKLAAAEEMAAASMKEVDTRRDKVDSLQTECDRLQNVIEEIIDDADTCNGRRGIGLAVDLQNDLAKAKKYITRLEEEMKVKDNDLRLANQQTAEYSQRQSELVAKVEAQELALESLVHLLELQRVKYERNNTA